jgi:hypothetical protein
VRSRAENERKFRRWTELPSGGRLYQIDVQGRSGWSARYLKEVDSSENTLRFWQEIYNELNQLVEVHEKFPVDKGHTKA